MKNDSLAARLAAAVEEPVDWWTEERFNELALALFRHQHDNISAYRRLCETRRVHHDRVSDWRDIPAVPTSAFKQMELFAGEKVANVFTTSGTTGGEGASGRSCFSQANLDLMETSTLINARRMLFPDKDRIHILVLAPSPELAPQMIMAWGMNRLIRHFGTDDSGFLVGPQGLDAPGLIKRLNDFSDRNEPVTIIGASFGFVNLLKGLSDKNISFSLPRGSRTMDAGGYKGRSEAWTRSDLEDALSACFGLDDGHMVNLMGMTELASQIYGDNLTATLAGAAPSGLKIPPPWLRSRVVDPLDMTDLPRGEEGVLLHLDLANLDTPAAVLTDDLGVSRPGGFEILGRLKDDGGRGCSLTVDEMTGGNR